MTRKKSTDDYPTGSHQRLAREADRLLKAAKCDTMTAEKQDWEYRRRKRIESRRRNRLAQRRNWEMGKVGPASNTWRKPEQGEP
jgi:hypothetical protein